MASNQSSSMSIIPVPGNTMPIKAWVNGVEFEEQAKQQAINVAQLPFVKGVCLMPDVHVGQGATIGSVIATQDAVIPSAIGGDIGCGMTATMLDIPAKDVVEYARNVYDLIMQTVPTGRTHHGGPKDIERWGSVIEMPQIVKQIWMEQLAERYNTICHDYPWIDREQVSFEHLGTLGGGNHMCELCEDTEGKCWILLHSGSRGPGARIGTHFTRLAKQVCDQWFIELPDPHLAYFPKKTTYYDGYMFAMQWALDFAFYSRKIMSDLVVHAIEQVIKTKISAELKINCHHNFAAMESHRGKNYLITRKGAVRARTDDWCIIPGSMGDKSYICKGLGNKDSLTSCSHGAGRKMSRNHAKRAISVDNHKQRTQGVICVKNAQVIDESPDAYKDIDCVIAAERDLVEPQHILKQFLCVKGLDDQDTRRSNKK